VRQNANRTSGAVRCRLVIMLKTSFLPWSLSRRAFLAGSAALALAGSAQANADKLTLTTPKIPVPALKFSDESGAVLTLANYKGRPVLLNLWATWCAPCVEEMPALMRLQRSWPELAVVPVAFDLGGVKAVRRFYDKNEILDLPVLVDHERSTRKALKPKGLPLTLVINSDGDEVARALGKLEWDTDPVIKRLRALVR
jgi:thiol-disulfide isomerase/thioredoxin